MTTTKPTVILSDPDAIFKQDVDTQVEHFAAMLTKLTGRTISAKERAELRAEITADMAADRAAAH